ncbi:hypothetical protein [Cerasicoccus arenae]|uniref:Uncharacterized protein n=1 Tax=Cerasicoccus arenae TaxID=424488 RepID=A0A8J3DI64_9BACT|nr:hypothetical protein [Cerasicoccus arenae]MBK1858246.1 hypothetical protein [Cerasicoccus arenae]GHC02143.1 hypothetical protein GCM10007047_18330 [Cerasicoccus arenae]
MTPETENAALFGGAEIAIEHNDGTQARVKVRALPLRLIPRYLELQLADAEQALAELFLGWEADQADCLTDESILAVLLEGERINFPRAGAYVERKKARIEKVLPMVRQIEEIILRNVVERVAPEIKKEVLAELKASEPSPPERPLPSGRVTPASLPSNPSPG